MKILLIAILIHQALMISAIPTFPGDGIEIDVKPHALVVGAGPAGILTAINLLKNGWKVTVVEKGSDLSSVTDWDITRRKNWSIGLSKHGMDAINKIEGLWEELRQVSSSFSKVGSFVFGKYTEQDADYHMVDRNAITGKMQSFLLSMPEAKNGVLTAKFETRLCFVDGEEKTAYFRGADSAALEGIRYDLLIGADGARSIVRNSLFSQQPNFESSQLTISLNIQTILITAPKGWPAGKPLFMLLGMGKGMLALFPVPGELNLMRLIVSISKTSKLPDAMTGNDASKMCEYLNSRRAPIVFELEVCQQLVEAEWFSTTEVRCNFYHVDQDRGSAIILGDAAHATSPTMGMGLNTGLQDAQVLGELLELYENDLSRVLPEFSKLRVKIGNALVILSSATNPLSRAQMAETQFKDMLRRIGSKRFKMVNPPYYQMASNGMPLDQVYKIAKSQGLYSIIRKNNKIIQEYNERLLMLK